MANGLTVDYVVNGNDYGSFIAFTCRKSIIRAWLILAAGALVALVVIFTLWQGQLRTVAPPTIGFFAAGALYLALYSRLLRWRGKRLFRDRSFDKWRRPGRLQISADGIRHSGETGESASPWSAVVDIAAEPSAVYLLYSIVHGIIVPRHAFPNDDAFRNFAQEAIALREAALKPVGD